ncbi:MAG: alginate lyase family protein, partial [Pseudomonadota bacterium]
MSGALATLGRLWRTGRWLKAEQVLGRVRLRLHRPRPELGPAPPVRAAQADWVTPAAREASLIAPTLLRFLAEEHGLADIGWDDPGIALLWRYNQHYFDDLNAMGAAARGDWHRALVERWRADNPPGHGTAWAPYPTSLRIVNWVKWFVAGKAPEPAWLHSLAVQARWLRRRIEWHLLGNHLFANAKALVFAGLYFEGREAEAWLAEGLRILERELVEQILADGAQFERTPMYQALALEDLLDLINIIAARASAASPAPRLAPELHRHSKAMLHWLRCMQHPGGTMARFNDCAEGVAPAVAELERYAAALGVTALPANTEGLRVLQPSGYVRAVRGAAAALLDVAPIGPDYLPGHAHADTLSFELSVHGRELIVNRGTSVYGDGPRRQFERGTAAHSTVQVGGHDSSEVWAGFRVGRRARPGPLAVQGWQVEASHDGYAHLPNAPRHHRRWLFDTAALQVDDCLDPATRESSVARFHLAPGLTLERADERAWRVRDGGAIAATVDVAVG